MGLAEGDNFFAVYTSREIELIDEKGKSKGYMKLDKDLKRVFLLRNRLLAYISGEDIYFSTIE